MRSYLKKIPRLVLQLNKQRSYEKVLNLITKFSFENLGNRSNVSKKNNLKKGEKNQFACGSFIMLKKKK